MSNFTDKTEEEINQLVRDTLAGQVFWGRMINPDEFQHMIRSVFLPIGLGGLGDLSKEDAELIGDFYEYLDKAGPRSVNGYPSFFSVNILSEHDREIFVKKLAASQSALDEALK